MENFKSKSGPPAEGESATRAKSEVAAHRIKLGRRRIRIQGMLSGTRHADRNTKTLKMAYGVRAERIREKERESGRERKRRWDEEEVDDRLSPAVISFVI